MRGLGIFLLALEIALMILYGLLTSVKNTFSTTTDNSAYLIMYLLPGILAPPRLGDSSSPTPKTRPFLD
jgi:hypothetical protein